MLALSACSSEGDEPTGDQSSTPSASLTADPKQVEARDAALAAFHGMREEQVKAYAKGKASGTRLSTYAADKALSKIESELFKYRQAGVVFTGKPTSEAKVTAVDLKRNPHKATITECFDTTAWKAMKDGKDVTSPNQVHRYTVTGAVRTVGERWMVVDYNVDKERTC
ncbi:hypothetical protein ABT009_41875 [Streptomyces sp. NPDC002896]|uniref:hypothetical protein n=1 Tax=Streptomyces sp. NPDC002896 TaxID=3154438 RepID=UPI003325B708